MKNRKILALALALTMLLSLGASAASYTVKSGDMLWKIAKANNTTWQRLAEINDLKNPNLIRVGQVLQLEETTGPVAPVTPVVPVTPPVSKTTATATAAGFGGELTVEVGYANGQITAVKVLSHKETAGIGTPAVDNLPAEIVKYQTVAVDTVTGATVSSKAILAAAKSALLTLGASEAAITKAPDKGTTPVKNIQETADVVIIGAGGAGMSAAVEILKAGKSVVILEKMPIVGGNTIRAGSAFNTSDAEMQNKQTMSANELAEIKTFLDLEAKHEIMKKWQDTLKAEIAAYEAAGSKYLFDSPSLHKLQTYKGGDYVANPVLIDIYGDNSLSALKFLSDLGAKWKPDIAAAVGATWKRSHTPTTEWGSSGCSFVLPQEKFVKENGGKIYMNYTAKELVMKDGKVTGVKGVTASGDTFEITGSKGVLLATGGFGANVEMRQKYNKQWANLDETIPTTNHPGATGDGIVMAEAIGANLVGMEWIQMLPTYGPGVWTAIIDEQFYVNKSGDRFVKEDGRRDELSGAILKQQDGQIYIISDANTVVDGKTYNGMDVDAKVDNKWTFKADTLADLAKQIGVPEANLQAAADQYNNSRKNGSDPFGRKVFGKEFGKGPFYAGLTNPMVHHTMGGVEINATTQVLNKNGAVIPGLFAAGEVTGGIHGANRLGGNAVSEITVFGRIAGQTMVK